MHDDDDWDDESDNRWDEDAEDDGYIPCQYCGEPMYEESGYCSACDRWMSREDNPKASLPPWMILIILLLLVMFVLGALRGF